MAPSALAELTWEEVRALDRAQAVAILPVGAIEAHGPHLPLGTDLYIAEAMALAAGARLEAAGRAAVLLPALPFTAAPFAAAFPGTLSMEPSTVTALLTTLARGLTEQRFAALAVANAHLDPAHLAAIAEACTVAKASDLLPVIAPDLTRKPWAARLTEEFRTGACHAGRYEGSLLLAIRPDLVRDEIRLGLPPNPASLSRAIRDGARTFEESGGPRAYFGWPADATAEEGRSSIEALGAILADAVAAALTPGSLA